MQTSHPRDRPSRRYVLKKALSGCGGGTSSISSNGPVTSIPTTSNSLVFTLSSPHSAYTRGTAIPTTFTVANTGTQPANLVVVSCDDFVLRVRQGFQQIWTGPHDICLDMSHSVTVPAGASLSYNAYWDQRDSSGMVVAPGAYALWSKLTPYSLNETVLNPAEVVGFNSASIPITITP